MLSIKDLNKIEKALRTLEGYGFDCRVQREDLERQRLMSYVEHAIEYGDVTKLTEMFKEVKECEGVLVASHFLAFIVSHTSLWYCRRKGVLRSRGKANAWRCDSVPPWRLWVEENPDAVRRVLKPYIRKCHSCGRLLNSVEIPGIEQTHKCPSNKPSKLEMVDGSASTSIRTVSGGAGPGTGRKR